MQILPHMNELRATLMNEILGVQNGTVSLNQAKVTANLADKVITSYLVEIAATKALPSNNALVLEHGTIIEHQ